MDFSQKGRELKPHIGIFGRRNNGKSSLINALAGQDVAIVSAQPGATTDTVRKSVEIFGIGPAILIDTAGIDDTGDLGQLRIHKTLQVIKAIDLAIIVITNNEIWKFENELISQFRKFDVPFVFVHNKSDLIPVSSELHDRIRQEFKTDVTDFSTLNSSNKEHLIRMIIRHMPGTAYTSQSLLGGLLNRGDIVMLITPIDNEAPEGRMILPQVQAIRDVLDNDCINVVLKESEVEYFLKPQASGRRWQSPTARCLGVLTKLSRKTFR
jgi:[FeFe] hydrogenase H-cluster maturation GTPase HydF